MVRSPIGRALLATVSLLALPSAAWAHEGPAAAEPADDAEGQREVLVTARRRSENIRDVPISVQAISGETLERKGTIDLQTLIEQTPGLNATGGNPRNFSVTIRGIGYAPTAADGLDNAIGVYFDGVYQARPGQVLQDLVDVRFCAADDDTTFYRELPDAEVLWHVLRPVSAADLELGGRLKLVHKMGAGVNTIDVAAATRALLA